jgi:hypothetical protein
MKRKPREVGHDRRVPTVQSHRLSIDGDDHDPRQRRRATTKEPRPGRPGTQEADNQSRGGPSNQRGRSAFFQPKFRRTIMTTDTPETDPQASFAACIARYRDHARRVAEARPAIKAVLFDALARAGITSVIVTFDGYGDSGQIEQVEIRAGDDVLAELPPDQIEFVEPVRGDPDESERSTQTVSDAIETLVYAFLEETHDGWENDDGAYGDVTFDVGNRTITLNYNERQMESHYSCHTL